MKNEFKILLIEDEDSFRRSVEQLLGVYHDLDVAVDVASARKALQKRSYDIVLLDKGLPDGKGESLIPEIKADNPNSVIIILTQDKDFRPVKKCLEAGADDYVVKTGNTVPDLLVRIPVVIAKAASERKLSNIEDQVRKAFKYELVGKSASTAELRASILSLKGSSSPVLVTGESGCGKELIAHRIHAIEDDSAKRPFVTVNCAALPDNLVESVLFGHKKGAFTSADSDQAGMFELAHNGDLFLDEVAELPMQAQAKLLRVLQDGAFFRVGGSKPIQVSCRVIAATNKDMEAMVRAKKFREDLYYRLNVVRLRTTPLRLRKEDIADLVDFKLAKAGSPRVTISAHAVKFLMEHDWPGNIRELGNTIERAIIRVRGKEKSMIEAEDITIDSLRANVDADGKRLQSALPADICELNPESYRVFMEIAEKTFIETIVRLHDGDAAKAAASGGLGRSTIFKKLTKHGIQGVGQGPGLFWRMADERVSTANFSGEATAAPGTAC